MGARKISESSIENHLYEIFPNDLNPQGTIFGGRVLELVDRIAGLVAQKHSRKVCVTLLIDSVRFLAPAKQGEKLVFFAAINRAWTTSMEVGVKVFAENFQTGERHHVLSAYLTFVALDDNGRPTEVPKIVSETEDEKRRYQKAGDRREYRLTLN